MDLREPKTTPIELLNTKLALPPLRSPRLRRKALVERLHLGSQRKLTLISAGAGFGKTTLACDWLHSLREREPAATAAWVSLDAGENDPLRFWRYALTALQAADAQAGSLALKRLEAAQGGAFEGMLTALINLLASHPGRIILVLEDYHAITNPEIHAGVTFLLEHLPPPLHLALLTRSDPPLPLAYLRATSEINELRPLDLCFSLDETREFLEQSVSSPLAPGQVEKLAARTEGWPAGLRLAALALQSRPDPQAQAQFIETFTGSHRPILEYLAEDVLAAQPPSIQDFLLQTSFLHRLTGPLCDAITGRSDGAETLGELERLNLFLEPLDGSGEWYRYHTLFAEAMQHTARLRLGEKRLDEIAQAASRWYEAHALRHRASLAEAVEAALFARDFERAARLIGHSLKPHLAGNEYHTLLRWLGQFPEPVLSAHPDLAMIYALSILFTAEPGAPDLERRVAGPLALAEARWEAEGDEPRLGEALALRALLAVRQSDYPRGFALARQALAKLPQTADVSAGHSQCQAEWRAMSLTLTGWEQFFAGQMNDAQRTITTARSIFQSVRNIFGLLDTTVGLGDIHLLRAEARQAEEFYRQGLAEIEAAPIGRKDRLRRQGRALAGLARLAYEQDHLATAGEYAAQALEIAQEIASEELLAEGQILLARVDWAQNDLEAARLRLSSLAARLKRPPLLRELQAWQAWLSLSTGDLDAARRWLARTSEADDVLPELLREREGLVQARVRLAAGEAGAALHLLETWLERARSQGRGRSELEIHILTAIALEALGQPPAAAEALARAQALAQPQSFRRVFLDERDNLARLLREPPHPAAPSLNWVRRLFSPANGSNRPLPVGCALEPCEALSRQEERVLRLLAGGLSNPEIAEELVISVNTVKTHLKNVYRKLNINSRREAREAVRHLTGAA